MPLLDPICHKHSIKIPEHTILFRMKREHVCENFMSLRLMIFLDIDLKAEILPNFINVSPLISTHCLSRVLVESSPQFFSTIFHDA